MRSEAPQALCDAGTGTLEASPRPTDRRRALGEASAPGAVRAGGNAGTAAERSRASATRRGLAFWADAVVWARLAATGALNTTGRTVLTVAILEGSG